MKLLTLKTITPGGGLDSGADEVLEAINRPAPALPAMRPTSDPAPRVTRLEPRGYVPAEESAEAFADLPPLLAEIASVAGLVAATTLAERRGGTRVYIPASAPDTHWLVAMLGREAADRLCGYYGTHDAEGEAHGTVLSLPLGGVGLRADTHRQLADMIRRGYTATEIVMRLGISRDTVKRHRRALRAELEGAQLSMLALFDDTAGRTSFDAFTDAIAAELADALAREPALAPPTTKTTGGTPNDD